MYMIRKRVTRTAEWSRAPGSRIFRTVGCARCAARGRMRSHRRNDRLIRTRAGDSRERGFAADGQSREFPSPGPGVDDITAPLFKGIFLPFGGKNASSPLYNGILLAILIWQSLGNGVLPVPARSWECADVSRRRSFSLRCSPFRGGRRRAGERSGRRSVPRLSCHGCQAIAGPCLFR